MRITCVYHDNCFDGMTAALVVRKAFPGREIQFIPANYGDEELITKLTRMIGRRIFMVDFSVPRGAMEFIAEHNDLLVLDHHKTAEENCKGLEYCRFDLNESGASLAWDYFFRGLDRPRLVQYIRDRDLWKFELPDSKAVNAFIQSFPLTLESYEDLYHIFEIPNLENIVLAGEAIERFKISNVQRICNYAFVISIGGYEVPVVYNNGIFQSEIGHELLVKHPTAKFSVSIFRDQNRKVDVFYLRSKNEFDVSEIAKLYGGGGHKNSAGFTMDLPVEIEAL